MIEIIELKDKIPLFKEAVDVFWRQWGSQSNYDFYHDCMLHSCNKDIDLPKFYLAVYKG